MEIIFSKDRAASPFGLWTERAKSCRMCGVDRASTSALFTCQHFSSTIILQNMCLRICTTAQSNSPQDCVGLMLLAMAVNTEPQSLLDPVKHSLDIQHISVIFFDASL